MKAVVVTGAAGGIGAASVDDLRKENWEVLAVDRIGGPEIFQADIGSPQGHTSVVRWVKSKWGRLDGLVNNAAIGSDRSVFDTDDDRFMDVVGVNLLAPFRLTRDLGTLLVDSNGAIVNVASVHAFATSPNVSAYAASKGGLAALTRAVAVELGPLGVRCNAVAPGAVETAMLQKGLGRDGSDPRRSLERLKVQAPLRAIGDPADIAPLITFLLDPVRAGYITGQLFTADGGVLARLASE